MLETYRHDIAIFVEASGQPTTVAECYERALCAEFRLNQMKAEKAKGHKDRGRKKNLTSEIVIKPSSSEKNQGSRKKMKLPNAEIQRTSYKKRNYVLKVYCRRCRHNNSMSL